MKLYYSVLNKLKHLRNKIRKTDRLDHKVAQPTSYKLANDIHFQVLDIVPTKKNTRYIGSNWLINFKDNRFSEHGEDGIINKIFEILTPENKWVCEFGAHDPEVISNTWRLINQEGWHAVLIEADSTYFEKLKNYYHHSDTVHCVQTKVSYEGNEQLDKILKQTPIPSDLDFMVIDIDGNDYHVWEAINEYQAKVIMIEFNAAIPIEVSFVQPKDMTINQGTSLRAMVELANKKGYKLVAATSWNAFFVQNKYFHLFFQNEPLLEDMYVFPAKHPIKMRAFQLYDGTIMIAPWNEMLWHSVNLKPSDYQVLPESLRYFSRSLANQDYVTEKSSTKTLLKTEQDDYLDKIFKMPGNLLGQFARNVYSRYGEDGIIEKLISLVSTPDCFFVDVGAFDGMTYSKSYNLSSRHGWKGLVLENDVLAIDALKKKYASSSRVKLSHQAYSLEGENTLDQIFKQNDVPEDLDLLLLNTYGMEYYLWESLMDFSPKMVAVQFNPTIPNDVKFIQTKNFSVHQGASLRALCDLAKYKGYELVAVTMETAFFVKSKYFYRLFEVLGLTYSDLDEIFYPIEMQLFQLYDGTLVLQGLNRLMWHGIRIDQEKLQVIPQALRKFHQFADPNNKQFFYRV